MAAAPNPSILLAKAVGLAARAGGMVHAARDPAMRDQLALVELAARDVRAWLQPPPTDIVELAKVESALAGHAKRLDDLEDALRLRADAKP